MDIAVPMIIGGIAAAWIGARLLTANRLMGLIAALLMLISVLLIGDVALDHVALPKLPDHPWLRLSTGVVAGVLVGAVSSLLGVAGGEFIIPILILVFGIEITTAGTRSLIISLPIVLIGVLRHRWNGHYRSRDVLVYLVAPMGAGSIGGAICGGVLSDLVAIQALKIGLAAILAGSAFKLWHHWRRVD